MLQTTIHQITKQILKQVNQLDAELLIAHVIKKPREFVLTHPEHKLDIIQKIKLKHFVKKRKDHIPLAYITKQKEFFNLNFLVNRHTLIPRPETEMLVEQTIKEIKKHQNKKILLIDVGTGAGNIIISIMRNISQQNIIALATDISKKAIKVAKLNAKIHNTKIIFFHGNLLEPIKREIANKQFDEIIITANLPYITEKQFQNEQSIQHEPKTALVAKDQGNYANKELLKQIKEIRQNNITVIFEIDPNQKQTMETFAKNLFQNAKISCLTDLSSQFRLILLNI